MKSQRLTATVLSLICLILIQMPAAQGWAASESALQDIENSFVEIAEKVTPTVVHLTAERRPLKGMREKMDDEDFFKMFPFPHFDPEEFRAQAAGPGVIINKTGYILTNNHLIEHSEGIRVKISESNGDRGKEYDGRVVGRDPATDLAVIKIEPDKPLPEARLGDSSKLKVGQWAIAIGDPFGFEKTVTVGVISGLARSGFQGPLESVRYQDFIQTDASINTGNSGGPLLNVSGEVIGINTFIQSAATGIGFAIPINMAKEVYEQLVEHGEVIRGFLGVQIKDLNEGLAAAFNVPDLNGALVETVIPDTPAEKVGLRHGDVVRIVDGKEIENSKILQQIISHKSPGEKVHITLLRKGEQKELAIELTKFPAKLAAQMPERKKNIIGLAVEEIPEQLARAGLEGVMVAEIEPGGAVDKGGLAKGDIILEVDMQKVKGVDDFERIVDDLKPGQWVSFYIRRGDEIVYKAVKIPSNQQ